MTAARPGGPALRRPAWWAALAVVVLAAVVAPLTAASPVSAAPDRSAAAGWSDGPCAPTDNVGVTIVVDFQELGGGVNVRCADGPVADGADALDQAGISWQGVVRWGRGFVCKIAGEPSNDPCIDTPPASAYWSYWVAPRGGAWCYANYGVLNRTPPPGSVEGWSFSLNKQDGRSPAPRTAPPALAPGLTPKPLSKGDCDPGGGIVATPPATTTTTAPPTGGNGGNGGGGNGGGGGGAGPGATTPPGGPETPTSTPPAGVPGGPAPTTSASPGGTTTTSRSGTTTSRPGSPTTTATTVAGSGGSDDEASGSERGGLGRSADGGGAAGGREQAGSANQVDLSTDGNEQSGFPLSTVVGVVLVVALGGGVLLARRRRGLATPGTSPGPDADLDTGPVP